MKTRTTYMNPLAIGFIMLALGLIFSLTQFKIIPLENYFGEQIPLMMSIFTVFGIFLSIPTGGLIQKFGTKKIVLLAAIILIIGNIIGGIGGEGATVLILSRAVEGVGYAFICVAGPAMVATFTQPEKIGRSMGIWVCWVSLGQIIAFNLTPVLSAVMAWTNIWFIYAAYGIIAALVVKIVMGVPAAPAPAPSEGPQEKVSTSSVFKNKNLVLAAIGYCGFNVLMLGLLTFMPISAIAAGMAPAAAYFAASIPMIGCFISGPVFGNLSIRIGRKKLYLIGLVGATVGYVLAFSTSIPLIYVGVLLYGLLGLGVPAMALTSVAEIVGDPKLIGLGSGVMVTFQALGMFLATTFFPLIPGFGANFFTAGMIFAIPVGVISIILVVLAKFR